MFHSVTIKARLIGVLAFLSLLLVVGGVLGVASLGHTNASMKAMYDQRVVSLEQLHMIVRGSLNNKTDITEAVMLGQSDVAKLVNKVNDRRAEVDRLLNAYLAGAMTPEEKQLADELAEARRRFVVEGIVPALTALQAGDRQGASAIVRGPLITLAAPLRKLGDALIQLQRGAARSQYEHVQRLYYLVRNLCIAATLFGIVLAAVVGWWLVQAITKPLDKAVRVAASVAEGDLTCRIEVHSDDETGRLMQALKNMRDSLAQMVTMARLGSWRLDPVTQAMTWSTETTRLFGMEYVSDNPHFSDFLQRIHEEDRQRVQEGLERAIATGDQFTTEHRIHRRDGSTRWVQTIARRGGSLGKMLLRGTIMDITERKKTFDLLRELTAHQNQVKEDERKRIAREIHDELGQTLLALRLDISMVEAHIGKSHPELNQRMSEVLDQLDAAMKSVRGVINNLRPAVLDLGLTAAIEWQAAEFRRRSGIACELAMDAEECVLDEQRATALFRILQESLTNVTKHAQATHVRVELRTVGDRLVLHVVDNGIGIDPEAHHRANSFGLAGMKERVHALDGEFKFAGAPGKGAALTIAIPVATPSFSAASPRAGTSPARTKLDCDHEPSHSRAFTDQGALRGDRYLAM